MLFRGSKLTNENQAKMQLLLWGPKNSPSQRSVRKMNHSRASKAAGQNDGPGEAQPSLVSSLSPSPQGVRKMNHSVRRLGE